MIFVNNFFFGLQTFNVLSDTRKIENQQTDGELPCHTFTRNHFICVLKIETIFQRLFSIYRQVTVEFELFSGHSKCQNAHTVQRNCNEQKSPARKHLIPFKWSLSTCFFCNWNTFKLASFFTAVFDWHSELH